MSIISEPCFTNQNEDQQNYDIYTAISDLKGFQIPAYDEINITYYGSTNNINTVVYNKDGSPVATLTLIYQVQPPTTNDANLVNIAIS